MTELLENVPVNLISVGLLGALALRRLVRMDGYLELRAAALTTLLWVLLIYLFVHTWPPFLGPEFVPAEGGGGGFTISANLGRRSRGAPDSL